ncbi:MAG: universal stress protein [Candidatus Nanopelagicales bacterium]|nr:universal stress protein [Candidatus Nanopelagicales bacterium]
MKLMIGVADDSTSADAVAFGATLAATFGAHVSVVTVSATDDEYINDHLDPRWQQQRGDASSQVVDRIAETLESQYGLTAQTVVHHHRSLGSGLSEIAAELNADLVVVGSGPGGSIGRFAMGSTTNQLLHHCTTPLALVPSGYARHPAPRLGRVLVAFSAGPEGEVATAKGAELARAAGVPLRLLTLLIRHRMYGSDLGADAEGSVLTASLEMLRGHQDHALSLIDTTGLDVSNDILVGDSPLAAMSREDWAEDDLLVVASARGGILRRVFLGDTTYKILRAATVPTLVLPRQHD